LLVCLFLCLCIICADVLAGIQLTMDKLELVRQSSSISNSGTSSPRSLSGGDNQSNPTASDSDSESAEERLELNQRLSPVNTVDVSSLAEP